MTLNGKRLTRTSQQLDLTLDDLEQAIIDRNVIELKLRRSFDKLAPVMKSLDRQWNSMDQAKFHRLHAKHSALHKALTKAQHHCDQARQDFHETRSDYDTERLALLGRMLKSSADRHHLQRCQGALERTLDCFVDRLKTDADAKITSQNYAIRDGSYDYIPYDVPRFLSLLINLDTLLMEDPAYASDEERYRPVSFLEVGCGPGRNLLIAKDSKLINLRSLTGFDINPDQLAIGTQAFGLKDALLVADAMSFDYSAFDVVFSFRPFSDVSKQEALEAHIVGSMREGAYLLAPISHDLTLYSELIATEVASDIWRKTGPSNPSDAG